jgi:hypothetical protein
LERITSIKSDAVGTVSIFLKLYTTIVASAGERRPAATWPE